MKKYAILSLVSLVLVAALLCLPRMVDGVFQTVTVTKLSSISYSDNIFASGSVEERVKKNVTVDLPVVTKSVVVKVGDKVQVGDLLATVDVQESKNALFDLTQLANIIPDEYLAIAASLKIDDNLLASIIPTSITATASGVISSIDMIKGGLNFPKSTVATISSVDDLYIKMSVNEQNAERLSKNDKVVFKTAATKDVKFTGTIEKIFPSARKTLVGTSQETVVDVSVIPDEVYTNLKPGYTVSGVVSKSSGEKASVLPYECIMQDDFGTEYVYKLNKNRAVRANIITGREFENSAEIISGISDEDIIVTNPSDIKKAKAYVKLKSDGGKEND